MARINIEDSLYRDNRFYNLCVKLGSKRAAIGALIEAWTLAQKFVSPENPKGITPFRDWVEQDIAPEILETNLARKTSEDLIEVAGGEEQFDWLVKAIINSRKGGEARAKKSKLKNEAVQTPSEAGRLPQVNLRYPEPSPLTLTPTLSLTYNNNLANSIIAAGSDDQPLRADVIPISSEVKKTRKQKKKESPTLASQSIKKVYCESFKSRYKSEPAWAAKENVAANALIANVGFDRAVELAEYYPTYIDPWHVKQRHPFALLASQYHKVLTDMQNIKHVVDARLHEKNFDEKVEEFGHRSEMEVLKQKAEIENIAFEWAKKEQPNLKERDFFYKEFLKTKNIDPELPYLQLKNILGEISKKEITA